MAQRRRLRDRMLLGLAMMVGCVGALIAGTIYGLTSYMTTMKTTDSKLAELLKLDELKPIAAAIVTPPAVADDKAVGDPSGLTELTLARDRLARSRELFAEYKLRFEDTVRRRRDPDPFHDSQLIPVVETTFTDLGKAIDEFAKPQATFNSRPLWADPVIGKNHKDLLKLIDELRSEVAGDMYARIEIAKQDYRKSTIIVAVSTGVALFLVVALIRLFTRWVFRPIRELQAGVQRVTDGDFNHPIGMNSADELQELGEAFDTMTQRLHGVYRDLERQVDERSRQLVRSERMVSVGFLAAGVSHEINNPLASIAFCAEALQSRLHDYLVRHPQETETIHKYLKMIQQEAFRCKGITGRLLEFSRMGERRREPTDLTELIQSVLEIAQHLQHCRGKRIVFQPYSRVIAGVCGEDVKSVVLNLVVNALESMNEGGVLTITLRSDGPDAEMLFSDTGCGMAPETLNNIFEPFYTRSRTGKGTGLGLFISHHIVEQHGGAIRAASAGPGQGSTFTVRFPISPVQTQDPADGVLPFAKGRTPKAGFVTEDGIGHAA